MTVYSCKVFQCPNAAIKTTDRVFIFRHYITHFKEELEQAAISFDIPTYYENKYSIINSLIPFSKIGVVSK